MSSPVVAWWRIPNISSASVLTFLPAGNCLTTNALLQLSTLNWLTPVQSSKLLLVLASRVVLGFLPRRDPCSYFCFLQTFLCFEMGPPFRREEGSDYCWSPHLSWGVWLSLTVLLITSRHGPPRKHRSSIAVSSSCHANMFVCEAVTQWQQLYSCLFRVRCLAKGLYGTIFTIVRSVHNTVYVVCPLPRVSVIFNYVYAKYLHFYVYTKYMIIILSLYTHIYNLTKRLSVQTLYSRLCLMLLSIAITTAYWLEGL
jgi:hypothetical protein